MRRIAEFVLRHRKQVLISWLLIVIVGVALTPQTNKRLVVDFSLPGQPGTQTANTIDAEFKSGGKTAPYLISLTLPVGQTVTGHEGVTARAFASVQQEVPHTRVVDEANTGDPASSAPRTAAPPMPWCSTTGSCTIPRPSCRPTPSGCR